MTTLLSITEFDQERERWLKEIKDGVAFIYPTDTVYGIGCDATNDEAVKRVRDIKERITKPFSVIAPSINWIKNRCVTNRAVDEWLDKLPGPYTLILELKDSEAVALSVNGGLQTIGVRIPAHWMANVARELGKPIVTTSANKAGKPPATSVLELAPALHDSAAFIIDGGETNRKSSTIIDLTAEEPLVTER